jgi:excisionase family DNA binding protein
MATALHSKPHRDALTETATRHCSEVPFRLLDTNEAAAVLDIGRRTLQERVEAKEIACIKIGKCVRFHPDDLADFINRNRQKAVGWKGSK